MESGLGMRPHKESCMGMRPHKESGLGMRPHKESGLEMGLHMKSSLETKPHMCLTCSYLLNVRGSFGRLRNTCCGVRVGLRLVMT